MEITTEHIYKIFKEKDAKWEGDNAMQGLKILEKYADGDVLCAAGHDMIYSIDFDQAIKNGIKEKDIKELARLNWMAEEDCECFACFV